MLSWGLISRCAVFFTIHLPKDAPRVFLSKKAGHTLFEHKFEPGTFMIFGKETAGLPDWVLNAHA